MSVTDNRLGTASLKEVNTVDAIAEYLEIHPKTVRNWIRDKGLQASQLERKTFITRDSLLDFLEANRV